MSLDTVLPTATTPLYARFFRRFRGILVDWIVAMVAIFGAVFVASAVGNDGFSRTLGLAVVAALLLYEPVLVSFTGGTLGHHFANLRVVDEQSAGNVSFLKACARVVLKGLLGWYSFVIMAATRRNQAIHDLLTRSTVQIRDPAKARRGQYITERTEPAPAEGMPSRWRRTAIICVHLLLLFVLFTIALHLIAVAGVVSSRCLGNGFCSGGERVASLVADITLLLMMATIIALGWKGKLLGARA